MPPSAHPFLDPQCQRSRQNQPTKVGPANKPLLVPKMPSRPPPPRAPEPDRNQPACQHRSVRIAPPSVQGPGQPATHGPRSQRTPEPPIAVGGCGAYARAPSAVNGFSHGVVAPGARPGPRRGGLGPRVRNGNTPVVSRRRPASYQETRATPGFSGICRGLLLDRIHGLTHRIRTSHAPVALCTSRACDAGARQGSRRLSSGGRT
jgi:hypothetical protein